MIMQIQITQRMRSQKDEVTKAGGTSSSGGGGGGTSCSSGG